MAACLIKIWNVIFTEVSGAEIGCYWGRGATIINKNLVLDYIKLNVHSARAQSAEFFVAEKFDVFSIHWGSSQQVLKAAGLYILPNSQNLIIIRGKEITQKNRGKNQPVKER